MADKKQTPKNDFGISLEDATNVLQYECEDAVNFMSGEYSEEWRLAEEYYNGKTQLDDVPGRSRAVKTEVRDAIRGAMPSIMRVLLQSRRPVKYKANSVKNGAFVDQQELYINQKFQACGGYVQLQAAILHALKLKAAPIKTFWEEDPLPVYFKYTKVTREFVDQLKADDELDIDEVTEADRKDGVPLYDVEGYRYEYNGKVRLEAFPIYEFFISRNSTGCDDAVVHGHRRSVTVAEAIELGLEYDNWEDLDNSDPELNLYSGVVNEARGYALNSERSSYDLASHRFVLTECYCEMDLDGTGRPQKYCFWLGGTGYEYIDHELVEDYCIDLINTDPIPFAPIGHSYFDLVKQSQDTNTSVLRAMLDNAHMANTPRFAADPQRVNFRDLMNHSIGSPIKKKGDAKIDIIDIPFTGQALLPVLTYLGKDTEEKVGTTKAATGLDPNAMQSTDKDAVRNTIAMAQGQIDLVVRNVVQTALIGVFQKILRLTVRHFDGREVMDLNGEVVPVPASILNPDLAAVPNVGLGTAAEEARSMSLDFIMAKQEMYLDKFGMDNPFTSMSQLYNTLEDRVMMGGVNDVGRYFNIIDKRTEALLAKQRNEAKQKEMEAAEKNRPADPTKAMIGIESAKRQIDVMKVTSETRVDELKLANEALRDADRNDLERDKMVQERRFKLLDLQIKDAEMEIDQEQLKIQQEQAQNNDDNRSTEASG